jgi:hypothetical protein
MNEFRQLGYINYNGDLEVHSSLLDAVLHEKPQLGATPRPTVTVRMKENGTSLAMICFGGPLERARTS